jgi:hypothetical protein
VPTSIDLEFLLPKLNFPNLYQRKDKVIMKRSILAIIGIAVLSLSLAGCDFEESKPQSSSGVSKATVTVPVDPTTGMTIEQNTSPSGSRWTTSRARSSTCTSSPPRPA